MSRISSSGRFCQKKLRNHRMNLTARWVSRWKTAMMKGILRPVFSTRPVRSVRTFPRVFPRWYSGCRHWGLRAGDKSFAGGVLQRIVARMRLSIRFLSQVGQLLYLPRLTQGPGHRSRIAGWGHPTNRKRVRRHGRFRGGRHRTASARRRVAEFRKVASLRGLRCSRFPS